MILRHINGRVFFQRHSHQNVIDSITYLKGIDSCKLSVLGETDLKLCIFYAKLEEATLSTVHLVPPFVLKALWYLRVFKSKVAVV